MKLVLIVLSLVSHFAWSQIPGDLAKKAKAAASEKFTAITEHCKKEKLKYCKDKELEALKSCLIENKNNLSAECKSAVGI